MRRYLYISYAFIFMLFGVTAGQSADQREIWIAYNEASRKEQLTVFVPDNTATVETLYIAVQKALEKQERSFPPFTLRYGGEDLRNDLTGKNQNLNNIIQNVSYSGYPTFLLIFPLPELPPSTRISESPASPPPAPSPLPNLSKPSGEKIPSQGDFRNIQEEFEKTKKPLETHIAKKEYLQALLIYVTNYTLIDRISNLDVSSTDRLMLNSAAANFLDVAKTIVQSNAGIEAALNAQHDAISAINTIWDCLTHPNGTDSGFSKLSLDAQANSLDNIVKFLRIRLLSDILLAFIIDEFPENETDDFTPENFLDQFSKSNHTLDSTWFPCNLKIMKSVITQHDINNRKGEGKSEGKRFAEKLRDHHYRLYNKWKPL